MNYREIYGKSYYGDNTGMLLYGDSLDWLNDFPENSIDMTITSPPYDDLRTYDGLLDWNFEKTARELYRVTKFGGVIVWIVSDATKNGTESGSSFKQALYFKEIGFNLHDTMIWIKDGGGAIGSNKSYIQNFEYMFVFSKGAPKSINLIYDKPNGSFGKDKSGVGRRNADGEHKIEKRKTSAEFSRRNNYWYVPPQRGNHPAVFPEQLVVDHILSWSNENDIILDPFAGSCTTAIACKKTNRRWICIEKVGKYCDISVERIEKYKEE